MSTINTSTTDEVITLDTTQESNSVSESLVLSSENISIECNRNGGSSKPFCIYPILEIKPCWLGSRIRDVCSPKIYY